MMSASTSASTRTKSGARPTKRRRTDKPTADDLPTLQSQANASSATAFSTRTLPPALVPPLTTLCIRVFAEHLHHLVADESAWGAVRSWLKALPDSLISKVFAALRTTCPTRLNHGFIVAHFLRGPSITLDHSSMSGVSKLTIVAIRESTSRTTLRELELNDFQKEPDVLFASVVSKLPSLRVLILRRCTKVGQETVKAVAKSCPHLIVVNFNYTSVTPVCLEPLLLACKELEVLKLAGISNSSDVAWNKLLAGLSSRKNFELPNLRRVNVRQTFLSDHSLAPFLSICPNLERLDISFTLIQHPAKYLHDKDLEKLALTSTKVSSSELLAAVSNLPNLRTLNVGALGGGQGSSATILNTSAMTMTDQTLRALTDVLKKRTKLERVNLVGNTKLGMTGRRDNAIADFIRQVGRNCKVLNLAGISSLHSSDLEGLMPDGACEESSQLQVLILNNTAVDDEAAPYISSCISLETLALGGTRFTNAGIYPIIDACTRLEKLDLTSCRGVRVADRRRFFEVWGQETRIDQSETLT